MAFDPTFFLNQQYTDSTFRDNELPEGTYTVRIAKIERINFDEDSETCYLDLVWKTDVGSEIRNRLYLDIVLEPTRKKEIFRVEDFIALFGNPPQSKWKLDMRKGKNVKLGRIREATGTNKEGFSLSDIENREFVASLKKVYRGESFYLNIVPVL